MKLQHKNILMHLIYHWNVITGFLENNNRSTKLYLKQALLVTQKFSLFPILLEDLLNNEPFLAINDSLR